jgi:hypothetical protein
MDYQQARKPVETIRNDCSSAAINTTGYTQLLAATTKSFISYEIYNGTTKILKLAIGGSGSEVDLPYTIYPGIAGQVINFEGLVPRGSRVSAKAIDANATTGFLVLNALA